MTSPGMSPPGMTSQRTPTSGRRTRLRIIPKERPRHHGNAHYTYNDNSNYKDKSFSPDSSHTKEMTRYREQRAGIYYNSPQSLTVHPNLCLRLLTGKHAAPCLCKWCVAEADHVSTSRDWGAPPRHHPAPGSDLSASSGRSWTTLTSPVRVSTDHTVQTNAPALCANGSQDFATPRPSNIKVKVIHKEKLSTLQQNTSQGGRSSRGDTTIPTAHVSPHQTSHTSCYSRHHPPHRAAHPAPPPATLRRTVSTNDFTDLYFRSASPPPGDGYLLHKAAYGETVGARRWNSYQNLQQEKTGCDSSRACSQSHLNLTGCDGSHSAASSLRTASSSMQHVGYTAAGTDLYLHHLGTGGTGGPTQDLKACMSAPLSPYSSDHTAHTNYAKTDNSNSGSQYRVGFMAHQPVAGPTGGVAYDPQVGSLNGQVGSLNGHCRYDAWTHPDSSSDISTWQQQHEEQLRRQHLEATKGLTNNTTSSASLTSLLDPHKLDAVKRAADSIIREKDNIIDKQKLKICDLERRNQESESDKHKALLHQVREENDTLHFKLQEVEYECASLKAKLTEVTSGKGVADMERHLRKSEHELKELRVSSNNDRQSRLVEQRSIQDMLAAKDAVVSEWQEKYAAQTARLEALQHTDLSTADSKRFSELREDKTRYKSRSLELERRLEAAKKGYKQRQEQVQELEQSNSLLQQQVKQLQTETAELRTDLGLGEDGEHALFVLREEVEDLRHDNHRLHAEIDKARKLLDAKHKKQQTLEAQHQGDTKTLEERLTQEEGTVTGLRQELSNKEQHLKKLRASVKDLSSKNHNLSEENSTLQEVQKELEKHLTGEAHKLEQRLLREMAVCFAELQSLVQICVQRAEGKDPNISVLLGVKGIMSLDPDDMQPVGDNVQSLKYKVTKIHELRQDIDNLREVICTKYAEDMGETLECTTQ